MGLFKIWHLKNFYVKIETGREVKWLSWLAKSWFFTVEEFPERILDVLACGAENIHKYLKKTKNFKFRNFQSLALSCSIARPQTTLPFL